MNPYRPEGPVPAISSPEALRQGPDSGKIFYARCIKCDENHNLHVDLGSIQGLIPREEAALGLAEGKVKDIALLSRVGKTVSFQVMGVDGHTAILSRRAAQRAATDYFLSVAEPGDVIPAVVLNPTDFGVFCDIGCGITALMRIDRCCISRLRTTSDHFRSGQEIYAVIRSIDPETQRIELSGRELLGTWSENAARFCAGQTVTGIVRSIMPYGVFIELSPNLSGLAESSMPLSVGSTVSVYIRSILPEKHKIKLSVLDILPERTVPELHYVQTSGRVDRWEYYPGSKAFTYF